MRIIGITGGIGSGKSVVSRILHAMSIPVYDCDKQAKRLMQTDPHIINEIVALLGNDAYLSTGELNKSLLAEYLFAKSENMKRINDIVHPRVRADLRKQCTEAAKHGTRSMAFETAILYESGFAAEATETWYVTAPLSLRIQRITRRDRCEEAQALQRIHRQLPEQEILTQHNPDTIIRNGANDALLPQILTILKL